MAVLQINYIHTYIGAYFRFTGKEPQDN